MMMNATTTLQPMVEYSACLHVLFFSTPLLLMLFSKVLLPPPTYVCAHSSVLPFPSLFFVVFQSHFLHSCCYELHNFENTHNFQQQTKTTFDNYLVFFIISFFSLFTPRIHFFTYLSSFN
jgi:hypothetical protein